MKTEFDLSAISKYRRQIFGLTILEIIIFHYFETVLFHGSEVHRYLYLSAKLFLTLLGSIGVDVFLFLSGMGIFQSLKKDGNVLRFYRKRLLRVVLPYGIVGLAFWIVKDFVMNQATIGTFLLDYSLLSFWLSGVRTLWYIAFIVVMYAVSPLLYRWIRKLGRKAWILILGAIALDVLVRYGFPSFFSGCEIAIQRVPIFLLGLICSERIMAGDRIRVADLLVIFLFQPIYALCDFASLSFSRLGDGLYALVLLLALAFAVSKIQRPGVQNALGKVGDLSLELFLTHVALRNIMNSAHINLPNPFWYLLMILISFVLSALLHRLTDGISKRWLQN